MCCIAPLFLLVYSHIHSPFPISWIIFCLNGIFCYPKDGGKEFWQSVVPHLSIYTGSNLR